MAHILFLPLIFFFLVLPPTLVQAGDQSLATPAPGWDNAINSLLATGMYGFDRDKATGLTVELQHADKLIGPSSLGTNTANGNALTFSYDGSSGLLAFSAGYILTVNNGDDEPDSVFLGLDSGPDRTFDPGRSWYLAFDLARSYQVDEHLSFTLGNRAMLRQNPLNTKEGQIFSMLFNMPVSYKNYLTISPEFQWLHPLSAGETMSSSAISGEFGEQSLHDVFYGGVSISFSY